MNVISAIFNMSPETRSKTLTNLPKKEIHQAALSALKTLAWCLVGAAAITGIVLCCIAGDHASVSESQLQSAQENSGNIDLNASGIRYFQNVETGCTVGAILLLFPTLLSLIVGYAEKKECGKLWDEASEAMKKQVQNARNAELAGQKTKTRSSLQIQEAPLQE